MHETYILAVLVLYEGLTFGSKAKSNSFNIFSFFKDHKRAGLEHRVQKNKEQVVLLVYEQIMVLCGSDNQSSLVAPTIQSNRAAQMVFAPWEV